MHVYLQKKKTDYDLWLDGNDGLWYYRIKNKQAFWKHGNTKSPTSCMYTWRYNILYLTILYNIRNVSVFVCIAFKNAGDWLTCQNQHNICKGIEKKSEKLFHRWNLLSLRQVFPRKINEVQWNSNSMWKSWWLTYMPKISSISASV